MDPALSRLLGCSAERALEGTPSLRGGAALGVLASSIPQQGEWSPLAWAWPLVATLGRKSRLTHNPTLHCGPHPCLVVDTGCRAEGGRLRGSGYEGATGPAKLVLETRLVCELPLGALFWLNEKGRCQRIWGGGQGQCQARFPGG